MFEKIWSRHRILERADGQTLLYVDRHLIHDGYAPAFEFLRERGLRPGFPRGSSVRPITTFRPIAAT
jgi:3-isopropylmalate/(R)-2-methylmalate dehydratase large subunit